LIAKSSFELNIIQKDGKMPLMIRIDFKKFPFVSIYHNKRKAISRRNLKKFQSPSKP